MLVTYNSKLNIGYIQFRKRLNEGEHVDTLVISDELNIDIAPDGRVFGIEFLNANEQFKDVGAAIVLENELSHVRSELPL